MVFFSGMPNEAAGPVADTVTPTVMSACAARAAVACVRYHVGLLETLEFPPHMGRRSIGALSVIANTFYCHVL